MGLGMSHSGQQPPHADEHTWVRRRMTPLIAGLLSEDEEQRIRAHLARCTACAAACEPLLDSAPPSDDVEHIPAHIVATWPISSSRLQGLEREMVERHLARCAECRADLHLLGHAPSLAPPVKASRDTAAGFHVVAGTKPNMGPSRRAAWARWALGTWATAATAAALTLGLMRPGTMPWEVVDQTTGSPATSAPSTTTELTQTPSPLPVTTPPPDVRQRPAGILAITRSPKMTRTANSGMRGLEEASPLPRPGETLAFLVRDDELPAEPAGTPLSIIIKGPNGEVIGELSSTLQALRDGNGLTYDPGENRLTPGAYELLVRLQPQASAPEISISKRFVLR